VQEALPVRVALEESGGKELQGHVATQQRVLGEVYNAHTALADFPEDLVLGKLASDHPWMVDWWSRPGS
jgi:hypothetical protein